MHPTSLLFTLASLFLFHQRVHAECKPVACGNFTIKYPFWLGGTHQRECGYRPFQVTCDRNSSGMAFLANSFWK